MKGKKILIGISGSIAAYKIPILAEVKVVMTPAAVEFVSPLVLNTLTKHDVLIEIANDNAWANHVAIGRWADLMLIAPASCNTLAKMAHGLCDNLLLSVYLSSTCPVLIAPAMDEDMWHHPSTKKNIAALQGFGHIIIPSEHGELASGLIGMGRLAEPETLFSHISNFFHKQSLPASTNEELKGAKALITAGPTYENLDPVRFIGNYSSGKMGIAIAEALANRGCKVDLVLGPSNLVLEHPNVQTTRVRSAEQMFNAVMSAAVADYTPINVSDSKIKKKEEEFVIQLKKTTDILKHLGSIKKKGQILIGFALESNNEKNYALKKLKEKNADAIVLNSLNDVGAGFSHDTNKITIFEKSGKETNYTLKTKKEVANDIVDKIIELQ
jgi:phosphopantothenoylcysteine decarboxylase/phosphopantothenate--cysteine ligase